MTSAQEIAHSYQEEEMQIVRLQKKKKKVIE